MPKHIDITNQRYGKLVVLKKQGKTKYGKSLWLCKCDCGNYKEVDISSLRKGNTKSCGCLVVENHPRKYTDKNEYNYRKRIYKIYDGIRQRCYNKKIPNYSHYGNKGIVMCNEWLDKKNGFFNFYNWAINNGYKENLTIDRIDVKGNYEPSNCRWITLQEQQLNRTNTVYIIINNKKEPLMKICKEKNISYSCAYNRLRKDKSINDLFKL